MEILDYSKRIAVEYNVGVAVIGGGPAGLCAAIAAARTGADVLLIEQYNCCGGMATAGLVAPFMTCYDSSGDKKLIRGLFEEVCNRMIAKKGAIDSGTIPAPSAFTSYITKGHLHVTPFKSETFKLVADEMLTEAGVRVLYHASFVDAETKNDRVERIVIHEKQGLCAVRANIYIDCTGDGDLCVASGVPYTLGNIQGKMQPATMFFRIGNVDSKQIDADIEANLNNFYRIEGVNYRSLHWWVSKAREAGDWTLDRVSIGLFRGVDEDEWSINTSRIMGVDGTSSESLSQAEIEGRRQVDEIFAFFKKYVPGCQNAKLLQTGSTVGIRETRHIEGLTKLTIDDVLNCKKSQDDIMIAANSIDIHGKFGPKSNEYITIRNGDFYGVPYGCLVPKNFSNLLVAGRCISAESEAAGAVRVMPPCMALGQAAGIAAALAQINKYDVRQVNVSEIRRILIEQNAVLD